MLEGFFNPGSVAVVGASREEGKTGYSIISNVVKYGFQGKIYPVNPKASEIMGLKSYPDLLSIEGAVDLAIIVIPPKFILNTIDECAKKGIKSVIIISAGFKETGGEGRKLESNVVEKARGYGIRLLGPNCLGLIDTNSSLNASFAAGMPPKGNIAFFSQSGALCTAILDWAVGNKVGFSKFVSLGNKADLSELELIQTLADDPETSVILGYLEGVEKGPEFMDVARKAARKKPLIIVKAGGTAAGARAASSHTGTLAGADKAFQAAFDQSGIIRAMSIEDLFDYALSFAGQPLPSDSRLAIITNAGGPGIIAADACERFKVELAELTGDTINKLRESLPPVAGFFNPVDVIGDARADRYDAAVNTVLADPNVNGALVILTPQAMTEADKTAEIVVRASKTGKPVIASFMGEASIRTANETLRNGGVPNYPYPERGVKAFATMVRYARWLKEPEPLIAAFDVNRDKVREIFASMKTEGRLELGEKEAREVIKAYGFRIPKAMLARTSEESAIVAKGIGFPVVMKIASPDILHKTEVGGVRVGLASEEEVERAFLEITSNASRLMPKALIWGVSIQEMVKKGKEVIVGMSKDHSFGPLLMFGLGGIYVEVLKDVSFRVAPAGKTDIERMISEIRSYPLLKGVRGEPPADTDALVEAIQRLSQLVNDFPEIIEMDINPLVVLPKGEGVIAIDARMTLE
ncbi:MAG: acetyl coenzyme synthetase forming, alpha domain protein [Deltaproteobacteria bacterium]|nr:acetyl coenzyme synthetase forming, alpha domain protein [Deltaproteobacteria bacterium]